VDASLLGSGLGIKAYVLSSLSLPSSEKVLGSQFQPVKLDIDSAEAEQIAVQQLMRAKSKEGETQASLSSDLGNIEIVISKILEHLEIVSNYIDRVVKGEVTPNGIIGRFLADTIASLPRIETQTFEKMFNDSVQDVLMVVYLSNLIRCQLSISERLQYLVAPSNSS